MPERGCAGAGGGVTSRLPPPPPQPAENPQTLPSRGTLRCCGASDRSSGRCRWPRTSPAVCGGVLRGTPSSRSALEAFERELGRGAAKIACRTRDVITAYDLSATWKRKGNAKRARNRRRTRPV
ncbi:unnamed protein product, partial [Iphiclides podalirius]